MMSLINHLDLFCQLSSFGYHGRDSSSIMIRSFCIFSILYSNFLLLVLRQQLVACFRVFDSFRSRKGFYKMFHLFSFLLHQIVEDLSWINKVNSSSNLLSHFLDFVKVVVNAISSCFSFCQCGFCDEILSNFVLINICCDIFRYWKVVD